MYSKKNLIATFTLFLVFMAFHAQADIYRCANENGSVTLSNVEKGQNCKKMILPPPDSKRPISAKTDTLNKSTPASDIKPVEKSKGSYDVAAAERKRIIQEEMDLEKVRLNAVQTRVKELTALPNKTPEQMKDLVALQQKENLHSSNLQILQKELNK